MVPDSPLTNPHHRQVAPPLFGSAPHLALWRRCPTAVRDMGGAWTWCYRPVRNGRDTLITVVPVRFAYQSMVLPGYPFFGTFWNCLSLFEIFWDALSCSEFFEVPKWLFPLLIKPLRFFEMFCNILRMFDPFWDLLRCFMMVWDALFHFCCIPLHFQVLQHLMTRLFLMSWKSSDLITLWSIG